MTLSPAVELETVYQKAIGRHCDAAADPRREEHEADDFATDLGERVRRAV
ncbi:MAG: hypothetical protein GXX91_14035 [Verrucomicrobiaceae bacterium]|nr:hypothetical protein [Verrucomicrobiaceae bacterium]